MTDSRTTNEALDFDPEPLRALREVVGVDDGAMVDDFINTFLESTARILAALRLAASAGNAKAVADGAHALKGACGNAGAVKLQKLSARLEAHAQTEALDESIALVAALETEFARVHERLLQELGPAAPAGEIASRPGRHPPGRKVLIVDDAADIRQALLLALYPVCTALEAANGVDALRLLKREKPSLLLLDVSMPEMGGLALLRAARALDPSLSVVMISGHQDIRIARRALLEGARAYITKPFDARLLRAEVERFFSEPTAPVAGRPPWKVAS